MEGPVSTPARRAQRDNDVCRPGGRRAGRETGPS